MAKKLKMKFEKLGLDIPQYTHFEKAFPHLENTKDELVEVKDKDDEEQEELLDVGNYKSEGQIQEELDETQQDLKKGKSIFSRWFGKEKEKQLKPDQLARVSEITGKKKASAPKAVIKETKEGTVMMQPSENERVKREQTKIEAGFQIPKTILEQEDMEKIVNKIKNVVLSNPEKIKILHEWKKHTDKKYAGPYVDYQVLKKNLKSINTELEKLSE